MRLYKRIIILIFVIFCAYSNLDALGETEANVVSDVSVDLSSPYLPITVRAEKGISYKSFTLKSPERIVVDLFNCKLSGEEKKIIVGKRTIQDVRVAQNQLSPDIVRLVIDLTEQTHYRIQVKGKEIVILFMLVIKDITVKSGDNSSIIYMKGASQSEFDEQKVDNPFRIVFDFKESILEGSQRKVQHKEGGIERIRAAQFSIEPPIVRIVFDVNVYLRYKIQKQLEEDKLAIELIYPAVYGKVIAIDAGHGGKDPGAISVFGDFEKDINLKIAKNLRDYLMSVGAKVVMTRESDVFVPLEERAKIANLKNSEVFISIHENALKGGKISGTETYYYGEAGKKLCGYIHPHLLNAIQLTDKDIKRAKFLVLKNTSMPATLVEIGYLTSSNDAKLLKNENFLKNCAVGMYNGLESYFGGDYSYIPPIKLTKDVITDLDSLKQLGVSEDKIDEKFTTEELPSDLEVIKEK